MGSGRYGRYGLRFSWIWECGCCLGFLNVLLGIEHVDLSILKIWIFIANRCKSRGFVRTLAFLQTTQIIWPFYCKVNRSLVYFGYVSNCNLQTRNTQTDQPTNQQWSHIEPWHHHYRWLLRHQWWLLQQPQAGESLEDPVIQCDIPQQSFKYFFWWEKQKTICNRLIVLWSMWRSHFCTSHCATKEVSKHLGLRWLAGTNSPRLSSFDKVPWRAVFWFRLQQWGVFLLGMSWNV